MVSISTPQICKKRVEYFIFPPYNQLWAYYHEQRWNTKTCCNVYIPQITEPITLVLEFDKPIKEITGFRVLKKSKRNNLRQQAF